MSTLLNKILSGDGITPDHHKINDPDRCDICGHSQFIGTPSGWQCEVCKTRIPFETLKFNPTTTAPIEGQKEDPINPDHYKAGAFECIEVMKAISTPEEFQGYLKLTAFKYGWRAGKKDDEHQDRKKQAWFINRLLKELEAAQ